MRPLAGVLSLVVGCVFVAPAVVCAQATLTGTVRDTSGAVLPGVIVETSSPVLIEKVRSVVTDSSGQYRITELPPGRYQIIFALTGFTAVRRQGVDVRGSGVIPINAELRVGALEETITVTGETPLVDTQTTRRETVLTTETIQTLPATRAVMVFPRRVTASTIWEKVREGDFPAPVSLTGRRRGWLEHEVEGWIAERAADRESTSSKPIAPGRARFWQEVREGKRPHPRTAGRLKREHAAREGAAQ